MIRYEVIPIEVSCWMGTVIGKGGRKGRASLERSVILGNGNRTLEPAGTVRRVKIQGGHSDKGWVKLCTLGLPFL